MMNFTEYAKVRLGLESRLRESYEEEFNRNIELDLERKQLVQALRENFEKYGKVHAEAEKLRRDIKECISKIEADYNRKEVSHER